MQNKTTRTKGFTLVELIVVLSLIGMLALLSTLSISTFMERTTFRTQNEYAQSLFVAAQNSLTRMKVSGMLEGIAEEIMDTGIPLTAEMVYTENFSELAGRIYSISKPAGSSDGTLIEKILGDYIYDKTILNAAITIEIDPNDGIVYAVLYSERVESFSYGSGGVAINDRTEDYRRSLMIGYYCADDLSAITPGSLGKPVINRLELINDETFTLRWSLSDRYIPVMNVLMYTIKVYNQNDLLLMSFAINGTNSEIEQRNASTNEVTCDVTFYNEYGEIFETKPITMVAYAENSEFRLILDAIDISDDSVMSFSKFDLTESDSLTLDKIYIKMQASGTSYKSSVWKNTNVESPYFADVSNNGDIKELMLKNARHLNNIRFFEEIENDGYTYVQTANIVWGGENGILARGNVFNGYSRIYQTDLSFVPIDSLGENSYYITKYAGNASNRFSIQNLMINTTGAAGLFLENKGTISYMTLISADIKGGDKVGAICAENIGMISQSTVNGKVVGNRYVGGIIGFDKAFSSIEIVFYQNNTNNASVSGIQYVGGICGYSDGSNVIFANNTNTGIITAINGVDGEEPNGGMNCVGGILGYNKEAKIEGCISTIISQPSSVDDLFGSAIGGIVGYNSPNGKLLNCQTGNAGFSGYVYGGIYVGGLIGYQESSGSDEILEGEGSVNRSNIIGREYVGGIVGMIEDSPGSSGITLRKWTNEGVVTASEQYAGGIAGYNGGIIDTCYLSVNTGSSTSNDMLNYAKKWGENGIYIGGIVGYNNNTITADTLLSVSCIVYGKSYVGGIVGYNAANAVINNYKLGGGHIAGETFIGGAIGLNLSTEIFTNTLEAQPNFVSGDYFIGGIIGANILKIDNHDTLYSSFNVDNFLGNIDGKAGAFTGGFIGYIAVLPQTYSEQNCLDYISSILPEDEESVMEVINKIDEINENILNSNGVFAIEGDGSLRNHIYMIKGGLHVGGLVGGIAKMSNVTISSYTNESNVTSTKTMTENGYSFSFAGGIIGLCPENVTIINCQNSSSAVISTNGYFTGGLVELNRGTVEECRAGSIGTLLISNLGGLVGFNDETGIVRYSMLEATATVTGRNTVGGLVAYNKGTVLNNTIRGRVSGMTDIGGAVGYNEGTVMEVETDGLTVSSSTANVGGIVGKNNGDLIGCQTDAGTVVTGYLSTGGIIGVHSGNKTIENNINNATVTGETNETSGIIGSVLSTENVVIKNSTNNGTITAKAGNAGGILCTNPSNVTIESCVNSAVIEASKGYAGGISAENNGKIDLCEVSSGLNTADPTNEIRGLKYIGGITAINRGEINESKVIKFIVRDITGGRETSFIGGVAGLNESSGKIYACDLGNSTAANTVKIWSYISNSMFGGLAGENKGEIVGKSNFSTVYGQVIFGGSTANLYTSHMGNFGGLVGENRGTLKNYMFSGTVTANSGSAYGYGGCVGINRSGATIENCVFTGDLKAQGASSERVNVGGIAGINELNAYVKASTLSTATITVNGGHVGGLVGYNYGFIEDCVVKTEYEDKTVAIVSNYGDIAGIVGRNAQYGRLTNCETGEQWSITVNQTVTDDTAAGIIGYNVSDLEQSKLVNRANVTKTVNNSNSVGGIIGRNENATSTAWVISDCENYGRINGRERVGGVIGQIKYNLGTIENCINEGSVSATANHASGIIAYTLSPNANTTLTINNCKNFGTITGNTNIGGILGCTSSGTNLNTAINDCVNVGSINSTTTGSGKNIGGIVGNNSNVPTVIKRCRNYGTSNNASYFGGISYFGVSGQGITLHDCIGVNSTITHPLIYNLNKNSTVYSNVVSSYYIGEQTTSSGTYVSGVSVNENNNYSYSSNPASTGFLTAIRDNNTGTSGIVEFEDRNEVTSSNPFVICFDLSKPADINNFRINWGSSASRTFRIMYRENYGEAKYLTNSDGSIRYFTSSGTGQSTYTIALNNAKFTSIYIEFTSVGGNLTIREFEFNNNISITIPTAGTTTTDIRKMILVPNSTWLNAINIQTGKTIEGLNRNPNDNDNKAKYKENYDNIDSKIIEYYESKLFSKTLSKPTNIKATDNGGSYIISWDYNSSVYKYVAKIEVEGLGYIFEKTLQSTSTFVWELEDESWYGRTMKVSVQAFGVDSDNEFSEISEYSATILTPLPTPDVYAELVGTNKSNSVRFVLQNKEAFIGTNATIRASLGGVEATIDLNTGYSSNIGLTGTSIGASINFTTYAVPPSGSNFGKSKTFTIQTHGGDTSGYSTTTTATSNLSSSGFSGISTADFRFTFDLTSKQQGIYYKSEVLIEDDVFDYVSVSSQVTRLPESDVVVSVVLENLPSYVIDKPNGTKYIVRSYAWYEQNEVFRFGHVIAQNVTADYIRNNHAEAYTINANKMRLNNGYVVEYAGVNENGETIYNLLWSVFLAYPSNYSVQVLSTGEKTLPNKVTEPTIEDISVQTNSILFKWDSSVSGSPKYSVSLIGYPVGSNQPVNLYTVSETTARSYTLQAASWNYSKLVLTVQRLGTESGGRTQNRSASSTREFGVNISLSQITSPVVMLNNSDKDNLYYNVTWVTPENENELNAIENYTVYVVSVADPSRFISMNTENATITSVVMNFEENSVFNGNEQIKIYIVANAKKNSDGSYATEYQDSEAGIAHTMNFPARMQTPDINMLTLNKSYDLNNPISATEFESSGITAQISTSRTENGKYVIEALIYDGQIPLQSIGGENYTPIRTWATTTMTGNLQSSMFGFLGLPSEWAGYYIYIRIRSTSDSEISSVWSEYKEYRLPAVRIDTPFITEPADPTILIPVTFFTMGTGYENTTNLDTLVDTVTFSTLQYAKSYEIVFNYTHGNPLNVVVTMDSTYTQISQVTVNGNVVAPVNGVYNLDKKNMSLYNKNAQIYERETYCSLSYSNLTFNITLPNYQNNFLEDGNFYEWHLFTRSVSVTAHPDPSYGDRFVKSLSANLEPAHDFDQKSFPITRQAFVRDLEITDIKATAEAWEFDLNWSYTPTSADAQNNISGFTIYATSSLDYPVVVFTKDIPFSSVVSEKITISTSELYGNGTFSAGDKIYIYVVAKSGNTALYLDSLRGRYHEITLPIPAPSKDDISIRVDVANPEEGISVFDFYDKFKLEINGNYDYKYEAVYSDILYEDTSQVATGSILGTIPEEQYLVGGSIQVLAEFSDYYLYVRVKAISGNNSSPWSEYVMIRIPKLKLEPPSIVITEKLIDNIPFKSSTIYCPWFASEIEFILSNGTTEQTYTIQMNGNPVLIDSLNVNGTDYNCEITFTEENVCLIVFPKCVFEGNTYGDLQEIKARYIAYDRFITSNYSDSKTIN